ncbi:heme oxygenase-like [Dendronephthya gigantea]|uniref:heme oxygenase-like n=1 Tax=Dendronephthya gigantea TaxID=151771 RepID=UPI00106A614A|nr:heme oxygenase-like [Dendronephthya gigantea]
MQFGNMVDLCHELHTRTKVDHERSDKLINLKLLVVATDQALWSKTIANFYFIFQALEEELFRHKDHKHFWCLYIPELLRCKAFEEDLHYFFGDNWSSMVSPSPATKTFTQHIHAVGRDNPILLVAYCHSFYLALMAGGQIIKSMITKSLGLKNGLGTAAFQFRTKSASQLKKQLKDSINGLGVDEEMKNKLIKEKILAYNMTNAIVKEIKLEPASFAGIVKFLFVFLIIPLVMAYIIYCQYCVYFSRH